MPLRPTVFSASFFHRLRVSTRYTHAHTGRAEVDNFYLDNRSKSQPKKKKTKNTRKRKRQHEEREPHRSGPGGSEGERATSCRKIKITDGLLLDEHMYRKPVFMFNKQNQEVEDTQIRGHRYRYTCECGMRRGRRSRRGNGGVMMT